MSLCVNECRSMIFWLLMNNFKFEAFSRIIENSTTTIRISVTLQNWLHWLTYATISVLKVKSTYFSSTTSWCLFFFFFLSWFVFLEKKKKNGMSKLSIVDHHSTVREFNSQISQLTLFWYNTFLLHIVNLELVMKMVAIWLMFSWMHTCPH